MPVCSPSLLLAARICRTMFVVGKDIDGAQPERRLRINVEAGLNLGERFYIRASGLQGRLDGELQLRGEPGRPCAPWEP